MSELRLLKPEHEQNYQTRLEISKAAARVHLHRVDRSRVTHETNVLQVADKGGYDRNTESKLSAQRALVTMRERQEAWTLLFGPRRWNFVDFLQGIRNHWTHSSDPVENLEQRRLLARKAYPSTDGAP